MNVRKLLPLLIALAVMLVGCASTNEPVDTLSPTVPAVTVPADGILNTEVSAATAEPTATPAA